MRRCGVKPAPPAPPASLRPGTPCNRSIWRAAAQGAAEGEGVKGRGAFGATVFLVRSGGRRPAAAPGGQLAAVDTKQAVRLSSSQARPARYRYVRGANVHTESESQSALRVPTLTGLLCAPRSLACAHSPELQPSLGLVRGAPVCTMTPAPQPAHALLPHHTGARGGPTRADSAVCILRPDPTCRIWTRSARLAVPRAQRG